MKITHFSAITLAFLLITSLAIGQKVKLISGDLSPLKGIKKLNVKYDYSDIKVNKTTEKEYLDEKKENANSKEAGKGDKWVAEWYEVRKTHCEPKFEESFNNSGDIVAGNNPGEKYTLILKTVFINPGYEAGISSRPVSMDMEAQIVETASNKVVAELTVKKCSYTEKWVKTNYGMARRMQVPYDMAGKGLGKFIAKKI